MSARDRDQRRDDGGDRHHASAARPGPRGSSASRAACVLGLGAGGHRLEPRRSCSARRSPPRSLALAPLGALSLAARHREAKLDARSAAPQLARRRLRVGARRGSRARRRSARAPAATTSPTLVASMPPIANQGPSPAAARAACSISSSPAAGRPAFVGVSQTGPALIWSGRARAVGGERRVELLGRVGGEADERAGARRGARGSRPARRPGRRGRRRRRRPRPAPARR